MSSVDFNLFSEAWSVWAFAPPMSWWRTLGTSGTKAVAFGAETTEFYGAPSSPSLLDLLPIEVLKLVLIQLPSTDTFVLSLCSKVWLTKAWTFADSFDVLPFYLASTRDSNNSSGPPIFLRNSHLVRPPAPHLNRIDLLREALPQTHARSGLSQSHDSIRPPKRSKPLSQSIGDPASPTLPVKPAKRKNSLPEAPTQKLTPTELLIAPMNRGPSPWSNDGTTTANTSSSQHTLSPSSPPKQLQDKQITWKTSHFVHRMLTRMPVGQLLEISLAGCPVSPSVFKHLANSACKGTLVALNLEGVVGNSSSCMHSVAKLSALQYLNLRGSDGIGESSLRHLRTMTSLTWLDLKDVMRIKHTSSSFKTHHSQFSPDSMQSALGGVPGSPTSGMISSRNFPLSQLANLDSEDDSDDGEIDESYEETHFRRADIPLDWYTPTPLIFEVIARLTRLSVLYVSEWNGSSANDGHYLSSLTSLKSLQLQYSASLREMGAQTLNSLEHLSLATRTYANYYVHGSHFRGLTMHNLQAINFTNCYRLNDEGLSVVVAAAPNLVDLRLCFCDSITDVSLIQTLPKLSGTLKVLDLRNVDDLTENGLCQLSKLSNLQSLNLRHVSALRKDACSSLATLTSLKALDLSYCTNLTDEGVQLLAEKDSCLQWLCLRGAKLLHLSAVNALLSVSKALALLDLQECPCITNALNATKSSWREFKNALPAHLQHCFASKR